MKRLYMLLIAFLLLILGAVTGLAQEEDPSSFDPNSLLEELGAEKLTEEIPEEAARLLERTSFTGMSISDIVSLSPSEFLRILQSMVTAQIKAPIHTFFILLGLILITAIFKGVESSFPDSSLNSVFSVVTILCAISFIADPIIECISATARVLQECAAFILTFVPVFTGVIAAGGHPVTAGTYHLFLFAACQVVAQISAGTLIPLMSIYFAMTLVSSAAPKMKLEGITSSIKTIVCWALGLMTTVFVGLFSVQTMVNTGSDALGAKTSKFLLGSFVPVIGGALSDAFSAAQGCLLLVKSTLGAFAIIIAALTFIPILLKVTLWSLLTGFTGEIAKMMDAEELAGVLKSAGTTLSIMLAFLMCFGLLIIVCTTVVMVVGMGG